LKTMSTVFGWRPFGLRWTIVVCFDDTKKKENKIKYTMFLFLCVFCGLAKYDEGSRWDNFWDGKQIWAAQW
jgi:hypothetical protein